MKGEAVASKWPKVPLLQQIHQCVLDTLEIQGCDEIPAVRLHPNVFWYGYFDMAVELYAIVTFVQVLRGLTDAKALWEKRRRWRKEVQEIPRRSSCWDKSKSTEILRWVKLTWRIAGITKWIKLVGAHVSSCIFHIYFTWLEIMAEKWQRSFLFVSISWLLSHVRICGPTWRKPTRPWNWQRMRHDWRPKHCWS